MIKKIESTELIIKVRGMRGDDNFMTTLVVENKGYYILDVIAYCKERNVDPHMIYVYTSIDVTPQVYMVQNNGAIEYIDDYYD